MKFNQQISVFLECLQTQPEKFTPEALQSLDLILATLDEKPVTEIRQALVEWLQTYTEARDAIIQLASDNRELGKVPRNPESSEAGIRQNLYELRETRNGQKPSPESSPKP